MSKPIKVDFYTKDNKKVQFKAIKTMKKPIKKIEIKAWLVLDVDGEVMNPSISVFDTKKDAEYDAQKLNKMPPPTDKKYPFNGKNIVVKCKITYEI